MAIEYTDGMGRIIKRVKPLPKHLFWFNEEKARFECVHMESGSSPHQLQQVSYLNEKAWIAMGCPPTIPCPKQGCNMPIRVDMMGKGKEMMKRGGYV